MSEAREILRKCPILRGLDETELGVLAGVAVIRRYRRGGRIFDEGGRCPGLFVVASGRVRVFKVSPAGKVHVLHMAEAGASFAEVAALGEFRLPASAEADEESVCALVPADELDRLLTERPTLCRQVLQGMALWVRHFVGLLEDIVLRDASGRVAAHVLAAAPAAAEAGKWFALPARKKDLASHLNLTSETFSRALRRLVDAGLIEEGDGQALRVLDRAGLQAVADGLPPGELLE